jgi:tetratricopeptide (TPR) repeat protein
MKRGSRLAALIALGSALATAPDLKAAGPRKEGAAKAPAPAASEKEKAPAVPALGHPGEPGSGVPREEIGRPKPDDLKAPLPRRPRTQREAEAMGEMEGLLQRYRGAVEATETSLGDVLMIEADGGRAHLSGAYEAEIAKRRTRARERRLEAIREYEDFLVRHPDDPAWTPEVMFRLAELQFQAADDIYQQAEDEWEKALREHEAEVAAGEAAGDPPISPEADYSASVRLFRGVLERFPRYPHNDAALYMIGILYVEEEDFDAARQAYLALACSNRYAPPLEDRSNIVPAGEFQTGDYTDCKPYIAGSRHVAEAWLRVGEVHYDMDELQPALEAYAQASADKTNELYHIALIRMAWTLYLSRQFAEGVARFDEYVLFADRVAGTDEAMGAAEYRDEAVRYIAKCYIEDDWDLDGDPDRKWGFKRLDEDYGERFAEPHVPEIYAQLAQLYALETDFYQAIEIWETVLARAPLTPTAPEIQFKVLQAYEMMQDKAGALRARDALAQNYLRGSKWFDANVDNPDAIERAQKLAEGALVTTAEQHHQYAQELRSQGKDAEAKAEYAIAARSYEAYLERFPDTELSYGYRYQYAEALFFSDQYLPAAKAYAEVRDSNIDNKFQVDAAEGVYLSYEALLAQEQAAGRYALPKMPKDGDPGPFSPPDEMPELIRELQASYDAFVALSPDAKDAARIMYDAAALSQRYHHFDDAEQRYVVVIDRHCDKNISINSYYDVIDAHVVQGDLKGTQAWTDKMQQTQCGQGDEREKAVAEAKKIGNQVRFQEANMLFEAGEFEAAADRYVALVDAAPDDPNADKALWNAAASYENIGRFQSASQTYERIYTKYQKSEFADDALLRTAFNHARFFEYEASVAKYLTLATDKQWQGSEHQLVALKNAAGLLESLQEYTRAAGMYKQWGAASKDPNEKAEAAFRAAEVYAKADKHTASIAAYKQFIRDHKGTPGQGERVVESWLEIGKTYALLGKTKDSEAAYRDTIAAFNGSGLKTGTLAARFPAEAQFLLAENQLKSVVRVRLTGQGKKLESQTKKLFDNVVALSKDYEAVLPYKIIEWMLAARYRKGFAFEEVARKLREAPVPKSLKEYSEAWFAYKDIVDQAAAKFEDKAVELYREAYQAAKDNKVQNEWTDRTHERLNVYAPDEFPVLRDPALDLQLEDLR